MIDTELLELKAEMVRKQIDTDELARRFKKTRRSINYALMGKRKSLLAKIAQHVKKAKPLRSMKAA